MKTTKSGNSGRKAGGDDARVILKLYDLRRESEMRKARNFFVRDFNPRSADDILGIFSQMGSQENAWVRQVVGYWEMAASFVLQGALNPELFHASNHEMYFVFAKFSPFLKQIRQSAQAPEFLAQVEEVISSTKAGRERLATMQKRLARFAEMRAAAGKK